MELSWCARARILGSGTAELPDRPRLSNVMALGSEHSKLKRLTFYVSQRIL